VILFLRTWDLEGESDRFPLNRRQLAAFHVSRFIYHVDKASPSPPIAGAALNPSELSLENLERVGEQESRMEAVGM
jgi:hypothetical protein